ncbi:hypothetical protein MIND_00315600 [Mycena indigotica]|uniref:PBP domain-containing protein n=1 Tax=Mycena indigotica TaxID=2126181 RepID=A0A8H6T0I3_9AGAR|nr:uncharacterized protein MIND_00315600 [Mycena indigotica]KAF7309448.1 hypothetical protein MIND_00315600 [Mycena indigotica]
MRPSTIASRKSIASPKGEVIAMTSDKRGHWLIANHHESVAHLYAMPSPVKTSETTEAHISTVSEFKEGVKNLQRTAKMQNCTCGLLPQFVMVVVLAFFLALVSAANQRVLAQSNHPKASNVSTPIMTGVDTTSLSPAAVYNGSYTFADTSHIRLRIANGGAGQSGLVQALGDAFIDYMVKTQKVAPFQVGWYLGDTTQSLDYMAKRQADVAITYNVAAENASLDSGVSVDRQYGFRDHFVFVGPPSNPAGISSSDTILQAFQKIVKTATDTTASNPTRFLSRFDKSATNIKESEIFIAIGQVPWSYAYSTWYHQYPRFPLQAVAAAATLGEYTLTDRGTLLSSPASVTNALTYYICSSDDESDRLLNPAHFFAECGLTG